VNWELESGAVQSARSAAKKDLGLSILCPLVEKLVSKINKIMAAIISEGKQAHYQAMQTAAAYL
jgi:hypothetical protein